MIAGIGDGDARYCNSHVGRLIQLTRGWATFTESNGASRAFTLRPDTVQIRSVPLEDLDTIVSGIGDVEHATFRMKRDPFRRAELRLSVALIAHATHELAFMIEHENAVLPFICERQVTREFKFRAWFIKPCCFYFAGMEYRNLSRISRRAPGGRRPLEVRSSPGDESSGRVWTSCRIWRPVSIPGRSR